MSSPLSSLQKGKKTPLLPGRSRAAPFKNPEYTEFENSTQVPLSILKNSSNSPRGTKNGTKSSTGGPSDAELLSSLMHRLAVTERQLKEEREKVKEKEKRIKVLEEKCSILQTARGHGNDQVSELEQRCKELQEQVNEMEQFLEDYGMMWVGEDRNGENSRYPNGNYIELPFEARQNGEPTWNPATKLRLAEVVKKTKEFQ